MRGSLSAEINDMAHELVEFGKRCADAGRDWLSDRRNEMNRDPQGRTGRGQYSEQGAWRQSDRDEEQQRQQRRYSGSSQGTASEREYAGQRGTEDENYRPMPRYGSQSLGSESHESPSWLDDEERAERYGQRSGYEMGHGGPGGYGPQSQSQFTSQRDFGRGYGGDDYRQGAYAGSYGRSEPYRSQSRGMPTWESDRSMQGEGAQRSYGSQGTQEQGRFYYGSSYGSSSQGGEQLHGFRGRGPKNYTRSDDRIREDLCERLSDADEIDASNLTVTVNQSVVTLEGEVPHRSMKHWAEDMAESCSGVRDVDNRLRVQSPESRQASSTGEQRTSGQTPGQAYGQTQRTAASQDDKDTSRH